MEVIFLIVGLAFIAAGAAVIVSELQARQGTQAVRATVVGYSSGRSTFKSSSFHSVAQYVGPNGHKYYVEGLVGSPAPLHAVGAQVTVLVRPTESNKAVLKSSLSFVMGSILALLGTASVVVFWLTFHPNIFSLVAAAVVLGGAALKIRKAWRKTPLSLQAWQEYKNKVLSARVFESKEQISWADPVSLTVAIQSYEKSRRIAVPILFLLGFGRMFSSHYAYRRTEAFLQRADRTAGEVVELKLTDNSDDGSTTYAAVVAYTDRQGQDRKFVDSFSSSPPLYYTGQTVRVLYIRESPGDAQIDRGPLNYWLTILLGSVGGLFTTFGLLSLRRRWRSPA